MNTQVFYISPGYVKAEIWHGNHRGQRISRSTTRPNKGYTRMERWEMISKWLVSRGCTPPPYHTKEP